MIPAIVGVDTFSYDVKLQGSGSDGQSSGNFSLGNTGQVDYKDIKAPKSQSSFSLVGSSDFSYPMVSLSGAGTQNNKASVKFDSVSLPNVFYLNLREFNVPVLQMFIGPANYAKIISYLGKWIKFDYQEIEKYMSEQMGGSFSINAYKQQIDQTQNKLENPAVWVKLQQAFVSSHVLRFASKKNTITPEGVAVVSYKFAVDKAGLKKFLMSAGKIMGTPVKASDVKKFDTEVKPAYLPTGEIWLGTKDNLPYKLIINSKITMPVSTASGIAKSAKNTGNLTSTASLVASFKDYNQPISLRIPSVSQSIIDVIKPFMESSVSQSIIDIVKPSIESSKDVVEARASQVKDSTGISVLASSRSQAEIFYSKSNSYSGLCRDIDMMALLKKYSSSIIFCNVASDSQTYSISTNLPSGKKFCVDSSGFYGEVSSFPGGKGSCR